MNFIMFLLEFLLNNILAVTVIVVGLGITLYFGRKMYRELRMNRKLRLFQKRLRTLDFFSHKGRRVAIASLIVMPLLVVYAFFQLTMPQPIHYDNHATLLETPEDVLRIHNSYAEKFSMQINLRDHDAVAQHAVDTHEAMQVSLHNDGSTDLVVADGQYIYHITHQRLIITELRGDDEPLVTTVDLPLEEETEFDPVSLLMVDGRLVIIGHETKTVGDDMEDMDTYVLSTVHVYNPSNTTWETTQFNGTIDTVDVVGSELIISTRHAIDFDNGIDAIASAFPSVAHDDGETQVVDEIVYVEGTKPDVFIGLHTIDVGNGTIQSQAVLTSEGTVIKADDDTFYLFSKSYKFHDASEMFVISDPIDYVRTAITLFTYDDAITFQGTTMVRGALPGASSVDVRDGLIRLLTTENTSGDIVNHVYALDGLDVVGSLTRENLIHGNFVTMQFYGDVAYLYPRQLSGDVLIVDFSNPEDITTHAYEGSELLSRTFLELANGYALGIAYADTNQNGFLDGLRLSVYDMEDPLAPFRIHTIDVSLSDFNYMTRHLRNIPYLLVYSQTHHQLAMTMNSYESTGQTMVREGVLVIPLSMSSGFGEGAFVESVFITRRHNANRAMFHAEGLYVYTHDNVRIVDPETMVTQHHISLTDQDD